jgi:hypothetical protein
MRTDARRHDEATFEVRHPRCVSQNTKLNSRRLKVKTQLYYIYITGDANS